MGRGSIRVVNVTRMIRNLALPLGRPRHPSVRTAVVDSFASALCLALTLPNNFPIAELCSSTGEFGLSPVLFWSPCVMGPFSQRRSSVSRWWFHRQKYISKRDVSFIKRWIRLSSSMRSSEQQLHGWALSGPKHNWLLQRGLFFFPHVWVAVPMMFQRDGTGTVFGLGVHLICKYYCLDLFCSDRLVPELDTIVPVESTKAYDMLDIIHAVSLPVWVLLRRMWTCCIPRVYSC